MASDRALAWAAQLWCMPDTEHLDMDVNFAKSIAEKFDSAMENQRTALEKAKEALQWASGSPDFSVGGQARRGWLKLGRPALEQVQKAL